MKTFVFLLSSVLFYVGWFGSVFLARTNFAWLSLVFPILLWFLYSRWHSFSLRDAGMALAVSVFGVLFDAAVISCGLVKTTDGSLMPIWLISIWLLFSIWIVKTGGKLSMPSWVATLLGLLIGPLTYKSGEYFQVLSLANSWSLVVYALFWATITPALLQLTRRIS